MHKLHRIHASLKHKTVVVTGASRGIGRKLVEKFAADGANVVMMARSAQTPSHPKLQGTLSDVSKDLINKGHASNLWMYPVDLSRPKQLEQFGGWLQMNFGGVDGMVLNASAIEPVPEPSMKRFDMMMNVNVRSTYELISKVKPLMTDSDVKQVISLSPPLSTLDKRWVLPHSAYTASKYGMSMVTLGFSEELRANTLWPKKLIRTSATKMLESQTGVPGYSQGLDPEQFVDTLYQIMCSDARGLSCLDDDIHPVSQQGVDDIFLPLT